MKIVIVVAALVVANSAFAQQDVVNAGLVRRMNAHQDQSEVVHAGMVRQYKSLQRQVAAVRRQQADATKALAECEDGLVRSGKAKNASMARLMGACIRKLGEVKKLAEQVKKDEARLSDLEGRVDALENRTDLIASKVADHEERITDNETRTWEAIRQVNDLRENGPSVALLAGLAISRGGLPFNLGFGLSQPVADGDARAESEVLIGLRPDYLALTVRERVRKAGGGFVWGGNVMFLAQGRSDLSAAREVFLGAGPSAGWSGERVSVFLDTAGGPDRVAKRGWGVGGSAGLTLAVKF